MTITMQPVAGSSSVKAVGYDPASQTLRVQFQSGAVYDYADVPVELHASLAAAPSVGSFFGQNIRTKYPGVLVTSPAENSESS